VQLEVIDREMLPQCFLLSLATREHEFPAIAFAVDLADFDIPRIYSDVLSLFNDKVSD